MVCIHGNGTKTTGKVTAIYHFEGLKRIEISEAHAGDIVGVTGSEEVFIGESLVDNVERPALPHKPIDPPTIQMEFAVNDGPLAGIDGKLVTARHIWERLVKEVRTNVALRIEQTGAPNIFNVSGRGEMQSPSSSSRCGARLVLVAPESSTGTRRQPAGADQLSSRFPRNT